eukprot:10734315-Alexandrium_andersonii.AAC.1
MEGAGCTRRQATNTHKLATHAPKSQNCMCRSTVGCVTNALWTASGNKRHAGAVGEGVALADDDALDAVDVLAADPGLRPKSLLMLSW